MELAAVERTPLSSVWRRGRAPSPVGRAGEHFRILEADLALNSNGGRP